MEKPLDPHLDLDPHIDEQQLIQARAMRLAQSFEELLKLLGSDSADDRLKFFERWKGITTPREHRFIVQALEGMEHQLQQFKEQAVMLTEAAEEQHRTSV